MLRRRPGLAGAQCDRCDGFDVSAHTLTLAELSRGGDWFAADQRAQPIRGRSRSDGRGRQTREDPRGLGRLVQGDGKLPVVFEGHRKAGPAPNHEC